MPFLNFMMIPVSNNKWAMHLIVIIFAGEVEVSYAQGNYNKSVTWKIIALKFYISERYNV